MKKALGETQTLRAGCSKVEPKIFAPLQTPFLGVQDGQNLISWRWSLPSLTTQFGEDQCMQFRVIVVTDPQTNKPTNRQDRLQYTAPLSLTCSVNMLNYTQTQWVHWLLGYSKKYLKIHTGVPFPPSLTLHSPSSPPSPLPISLPLEVGPLKSS